MHEHNGAIWSGVYYVMGIDDNEECLQSYSGRLLIKPTPGPYENVYGLVLSEEELKYMTLDEMPNEVIHPEYIPNTILR